MSKRLASVLPLVLLLCGAVAAQAPGDTPQLVLTAGELSVPSGPPPFDNSGVFPAASNSTFDLEVSYLAAAGPNDDVAWGVLIGMAQTPFPTDTLPPPLFVLPPFSVFIPDPPTLDAAGDGGFSVPVPDGLFDGQVYFQVMVLDGSDVPQLKLSNGVRVDIGAPSLNASISFTRRLGGTADGELDGLGHVDLPASVLTNVPPLGATPPPEPLPDDTGLPGNVRMLPILPNRGMSPINPLALPLTTITEAIDGFDTSLPVEDTSYFPEQGTLVLQFAANATPLPKYPWDNKTGGGTSVPDVEVVSYTSKTPTSFEGLTRKLVGSVGQSIYPHKVGERVIGLFSMVTTATAVNRRSLALDARNPRTPHIVIPAFELGDEGGTTMDLDLYLIEDVVTGEQAFMTFDRVSRTWRVLEDTRVDPAGLRTWDPMVCIAPDGRSMVATVRVETGEFWPSDPDELWAIRLDGETWAATGTETWTIDFELDPDPQDPEVTDEDIDRTARSRRPYMRSVAIAGQGSGNFVAYVGLKHKFQQEDRGRHLWRESENSPVLGLEAVYVPDDVIVRDYIEVPLVTTASGKPAPGEPRNYITGDFGVLGGGQAVIRFDPAPMPSEDGRVVVFSAGADVDLEDIFIARNISIGANGEPSRQLANVSGMGVTTNINLEPFEVRNFDPGGHGGGNKVALSPDGSRVAWALSDDNSARDWLMTARTDGSEFGQVERVLAIPDDSGQSYQFIPGGDVGADRVINQIHFVDNDRIYFLMGRNPYSDPAGENGGDQPAGMDLYKFTISTGEVVNLTFSGDQEEEKPFAVVGAIQPAAVFLSDDRRYIYIVRNGPVPGVNGVITNLLGYDTLTETLFNITGDEFPGFALMPDLVTERDTLAATVETLSSWELVEGSGVNEGMLYFVTHLASLDVSGNPTYVDEGTDEVFGFNRNAPFVVFQATTGGPAGSHITNLVPNPYSASLALTRCLGPDPRAAAQHPYVIDLANLLFERDLMPFEVDIGGLPAGRVMDGSLHFIPPTEGASDALVFAFGPTSDPVTGLAIEDVPSYYNLANVSDTALEPVPLVLPLVDTSGLGPGFQLFVPSASGAASP